MDIQESIQKNPMTRYQFMIVGICLAINLLDGFDVLAIAFAAPAISAEWNLEPASLGILFSSGLLGMTLGSLILAPLADIYGRRPIIIGCLCLISTGMIFSALSSTLTQLAVLRVATGIGIGGMLASLNTIVAEYSSDHRRSFSISIMQIGYSIGATLGGIISIFLIAGFNWRAIFLLGGILSTAMIPITLWRLPESLDFLLSKRPHNALKRVNVIATKLNRPKIGALPHLNREARKSRWNGLELFSARYRISTIAIWIAFFCALFSFYFVLSWTPKILVDEGLSLRGGISGGALVNFGGVLGSLSLGFFAARFGLLKLSTIFAVTSVIMMIAFAQFSIGLELSLIIAFGVGYFVYGVVVGLYAIIPNLYDVRLRTTGTGWAIGVGRLGGMAGPYIAGLLISFGWERADYYTVLSFPLVVTILMIIVLRTAIPANAGDSASSHHMEAATDRPPPKWGEGFSLLFVLVGNKLKDPSTYILASIVGTVINVYGQFLVPVLRGDANPIDTVINQYETNPYLFLTSVVIAYMFPMFVGIYSSVHAQFKLRHTVSKAEFPDSKPDPVFRTAADTDGRIISAGVTTEAFLQKHSFHTATDIIGQDAWHRILKVSLDGESSSLASKIFVKACNEHFFVSHSPGKDGAVNLYLTRASAS